MADIELVIKISEQDYELACKYPEVLFGSYARSIKNGTPLPKGHGDLKDANKLKHAFISGSMAVQGNFTDADIASIVCNSPTIIEADMAESEE